MNLKVLFERNTFSDRLLVLFLYLLICTGAIGVSVLFIIALGMVVEYLS